MSQLLSKWDAKDNIEFSREMHWIEKEEDVLNLLDWLNSEASLQSRLRKDANYYGNSFEHRISAKIWQSCHKQWKVRWWCVPTELWRETPSCRMSKISTINNRLAMRDSKPNNCCRKCLRNAIQTFVNNQTDRGATNAQEDIIALFTMSNSSLNPQAAPYRNYMQGARASNHSMQGTSNVPGRNTSKYPQHSTSDESPWTKFSSEGEDQRQGRKLDWNRRHVR